MRSTPPPATPVIVRIHGRKALWLGVLFGMTTLIFGAPLLLMMAAGVIFEWIIFSALAVVLLFGTLAVLHIGLFLSRPVALRMDADGISGWYTQPATWQEIAGVSVLDGQKGVKMLGFALHDPVAFRDRQSAWQRLMSHLNGKGSGHHILISEALLENSRAADLLPLAEARLAAARLRS